MGNGREDAGGETPRAVVSLVVPCFNEHDVLPLLIARLEELAAQLAAEQDCDADIVLVDDGSTDDTWAGIQAAAAADARIRGARLSRNFGQQAALTCGYELAFGDAVVCLDADLQDPPEVVLEMVARWRAGFDVVYGVRRRRLGETAFKRGTARCFYWLIRRLGAVHVRAAAGEFRLLSRRAVDAVRQLGETDRLLREMVGWIGFPATDVLYDRQPRAAGETKWPVHRMLRLALDGIVASSRAPLRWAFYLAVGLSLVFLGYLSWRWAAHAWLDKPLAGMDSAVLLSVIVFGAANLLGQAVLGEYVGRIHRQSLRRPLYIVQEVVGRRGIRNGDRENGTGS
jgi:dolichol-phosphate mannosyltransferase